MINPKTVIEKISSSCKHYFQLSTFHFHPTVNSRFYSTGNNISKAINHYNGNGEEIDVIKWFDDFWFFAHIRFEKSSSNDYNTFITISIFQGEAKEIYKNQLFRAEWDNHENEVTHPQPHWHIYPSQRLSKSFNEIAGLLNEEPEGFLEMLKEDGIKEIDLTKMHFSMTGLWASNGSHIHRINDEDMIINWFQGVLGHVKSQLMYAIGN